MKPTKIRNRQIYRAPLHVLSKQLGSHLSKDLRQKYGKRSIRVTVGDTVRVLRGEYKGVDGKVKDVSPLRNAIAIEGIKKEKLKGGHVDVYIRTSNLLVTELNTNDKWRIQKLEAKKPKAAPKEEAKETLKEEVKKTPQKVQEPKKEEVKEVKQKEPQKTEPKPKQVRQKKPKQETKAKPATKSKKVLKEKKGEK